MFLESFDDQFVKGHGERHAQCGVECKGNKVPSTLRSVGSGGVVSGDGDEKTACVSTRHAYDLLADVECPNRRGTLRVLS